MVSGRNGPGSVAAVSAIISGISTCVSINGVAEGLCANCVQTICSIERERVTCHALGTSSGSVVNSPTCSSGPTNADKSENAGTVGSLNPANGDTLRAYRRASPSDLAMAAWDVVRAAQMGLSSSSQFVTAVRFHRWHEEHDRKRLIT